MVLLDDLNWLVQPMLYRLPDPDTLIGDAPLIPLMTTGLEICVLSRDTPFTLVKVNGSGWRSCAAGPWVVLVNVSDTPPTVSNVLAAVLSLAAEV